MHSLTTLLNAAVQLFIYLKEFLCQLFVSLAIWLPLAYDAITGIATDCISVINPAFQTTFIALSDCFFTLYQSTASFFTILSQFFLAVFLELFIYIYSWTRTLVLVLWGFLSLCFDPAYHFLMRDVEDFDVRFIFYIKESMMNVVSVFTSSVSNFLHAVFLFIQPRVCPHPKKHAILFWQWESATDQSEAKCAFIVSLLTSGTIFCFVSVLLVVCGVFRWVRRTRTSVERATQTPQSPQLPSSLSQEIHEGLHPRRLLFDDDSGMC
jgi:hypothetical protein